MSWKALAVLSNMGAMENWYTALPFKLYLLIRLSKLIIAMRSHGESGEKIEHEDRKPIKT